MFSKEKRARLSFGKSRQAETEANGSLETFKGFSQCRLQGMPTMLTEGDETQRGEEAILTAIDKSVVVLLERLGTISFTLEMDRSDTLRTTILIVMKGDFPEWADGLGKQLL